jgi:hypothetical protein
MKNMSLEERKAKYAAIAREQLEARQNFKHQKWRACLASVWAILPDSRNHLVHPWNLTADALFDAALARSPKLSVSRLPRWSEQEAGREIYSKMRLFDLVFADIPLPSGELFFLPEYIFLKGSPALIRAAHLREVIRSDRQFLFDSDVLFIWTNCEAASVFHHSGRFLHLR